MIIVVYCKYAPNPYSCYCVTQKEVMQKHIKTSQIPEKFTFPANVLKTEATSNLDKFKTPDCLWSTLKDEESLIMQRFLYLVLFIYHIAWNVRSNLEL